MPYQRVGNVIEKIRATDAFWSTQLCAVFLLFTAVRSGEVRLATWSEIDVFERTWFIPASRMEQQFEHRVPLSDCAMDVLVEARDLKYPNYPDCDLKGLVFPSPTDKALTDSTVSKMFRENNFGTVPHGLRTSFRMWAAEKSNVESMVAEHALAHVEGSESLRAYQRSDVFERRRGLMDGWADFIENETMPEGWE